MNEEDIALVRRFRQAEPPDDPMIKARVLGRLRREFHSTTARPRPIARRTVMTGLVAAGVAITVVVAGYAMLWPPAGRRDPLRM